MCIYNVRKNFVYKKYLFKFTILQHNFIMYYLKHEQQCFIRYKDTRWSWVSLGLIKHTLRMIWIASKTIQLVSPLLHWRSDFQKIHCRENQSKRLCKSREISITYKDTLMIFLCVFLMKLIQNIKPKGA
jgi:hypothetical protein